MVFLEHRIEVVSKRTKVALSDIQARNDFKRYDNVHLHIQN